jgi:tetratricopeptide (TPR) repeat protein
MKHATLLLLIGLAGWCASCTRISEPYPYSMQMAIDRMEQHPDSALTWLQDMADSLEALPEETRMYHQLLTLQAEDLQYIMHTNDSLITSLVQYYETQEDECKKAQAYYLMGKVYIGMDDAPQALKAFRQALDIPSIDREMKERIYSEMAPLFSKQGLTDDAIQANQQLLDIYQSQGHRQGMAMTQWSIARMFEQKAGNDSAVHYYREACHSALVMNDSTTYYGILAEWTGLQYEMERNPELIYTLKKVEQREDILDKSNIHFILAQMYKDAGRMDSMAYYSHKVIESGNIEKVYYSYRELYELEKLKQNPIKALEYMEKAMSSRNLLQTISQMEALAQINSLYNYQHISDENADLKLNRVKQKNVILILVLLLVSITFACFAIITYQRKRSRQALERERKLKQLVEERYAKSQKAVSDNEQSIAELTKLLAKAQEENNQLMYGSLTVQMKKLQLQNEEILLSQNEQRKRIKVFQGGSLYQRIQQASADDAILLTEHDWKEVWKAIDYMYPSFNKHLSDIFPGIAPQTRQLCWLSKMGIKPTGIARILKRSRQAITNTRAKLNKVIADSSLPDTNLDDFLTNLS